MIITVDIYIYGALNSQGSLYSIANIFIVIILVIYLMMHMYIYPMMVTFKFTIVQLYKNALLFALMKFLPNLGILIVSALIIIITMMISPMSTPVFFIFINFGLISFTTNYHVYPYLKKYIIDRHEEETKKKQIEEN